MKRYSVLFFLVLELCVNPCFAQSARADVDETIMQTFTLLRAGTSVKIAWQTSTEKNNNYFEVQRSSDGEAFNTIAVVFAREQADNGADYLFMDQNPGQPGSPVVYYRIRQVNMDGKFTVTETRRFKVVENGMSLP